MYDITIFFMIMNSYLNSYYEFIEDLWSLIHMLHSMPWPINSDMNSCIWKISWNHIWNLGYQGSRWSSLSFKLWQSMIKHRHFTQQESCNYYCLAPSWRWRFFVFNSLAGLKLPGVATWQCLLEPSNEALWQGSNSQLQRVWRWIHATVEGS